jgi:predicted amidohydrolase
MPPSLFREQGGEERFRTPAEYTGFRNDSIDISSTSLERLMKIGLIQTSPRFGDKKANRLEIESLAGTNRADLWLIPELALTGYQFVSREEVHALGEEIPGGESCQWLQRFCSARGCHAVMGLAERAGDHVYNSAVLMGPKGPVGHYRKIHLFDFEKECFDPGDLPFQVFDVGGVRVGLMICFDWRFPESARTLALRGAQVIAHPSNLVQPFCQAAMVTRSLENRVFCATVNRIGEERRTGKILRFTGGSQVVGPDGKVMGTAPADTTACVIVEIDPTVADEKHATSHNDVLADRRPEFYQE